MVLCLYFESGAHPEHPWAFLHAPSTAHSRIAAPTQTNMPKLKYYSCFRDIKSFEIPFRRDGIIIIDYEMPEIIWLIIY